MKLTVSTDVYLLCTILISEQDLSSASSLTQGQLISLGFRAQEQDSAS